MLISYDYKRCMCCRITQDKHLPYQNTDMKIPVSILYEDNQLLAVECLVSGEYMEIVRIGPTCFILGGDLHGRLSKSVVKNSDTKTSGGHGLRDIDEDFSAIIKRMIRTLENDGFIFISKQHKNSFSESEFDVIRKFVATKSCKKLFYNEYEGGHAVCSFMFTE